MKNNIWKKVAAFTAGISLIVAWLVASIGLVALNNDFYHSFYIDYDLALRQNIRQEDADMAIDLMVDYVKGDRQDLEGTIVWKNGEQPVFNEKEVSHMVDVRNLWQNARTVGIGCAVVCLICIALLFWKCKKHAFAWLARGFILSLVCLAVVLVFFGFWMAIDFTGLWIQFHEWFFTNDLWALDPFTDFMIVICPESLFFTLILKIALCFGIPLILLLIASIYILRKKAVIGFTSLPQ